VHFIQNKLLVVSSCREIRFSICELSLFNHLHYLHSHTGTLDKIGIPFLVLSNLKLYAPYTLGISVKFITPYFANFQKHTVQKVSDNPNIL